MTERKLRKLDSLFAAPEQTGSAPQRKLVLIPHNLIDPHPKHPFRHYDAKGHPALRESIQAMGVLQPVLLQAKPDGRYTLLAGYKRLSCNKDVGNTEILALVDDEIPEAAAELIVTQTNTTQYGLKDFMPSELAYALKMELEAFTELRRQLKSRGETDGKIQVGDKVFQMAHLEKSRDSLAKSYGMTATNVQRYIQLTSLIPGLLSLVDQKQLALRAAVPLSSLPQSIQEEVLNHIRAGTSVTTDKALLLKKAHDNGTLSPEKMGELLSAPQEKKKASGVSLNPRFLRQYFSQDQSKQEIQGIIEKALRLYFGQND